MAVGQVWEHSMLPKPDRWYDQDGDDDDRDDDDNDTAGDGHC